MLTDKQIVSSITHMNKIYKLRKKLGLSQSQLGDLLGVSRACVSNYEKGKRIPKCDIAYRLIDLGNKSNHLLKLEDFYAPKKA